ncbi:MurR/RpiR family transcriptional regulator [Janibacter sp. HTCC2649]|uniref:MurR/RpiR family transcriptional regulator n=1 Tax=Janibacter sp. HTCC2649 TaxID=313589 RepID=UPI00130535E3|nr:MurR/RpiR family transcriptional regulator [Janibacter sp. HTCC2649]
MSSLSPREKLLARALLSDYPSAALGTSSDFGRAANVSAATVVRFARSLGYGGFSELQAGLVAELSERAASPVSQYGESTDRRTGSRHWFDDAVAVTVGEAARSLEAIPKADIDAAVALLSDPKRRVCVLGGRYSGFIARYLAFHLQQVRPGVSTLDDAMNTGSSLAIDARRRDVAVIFDLRRYQSSTVEAAVALSAKGTTIICVTDEWLSPVADVATVTLTTSVASVGPFDSAAAAFVLAELLVDGVLQSLGQKALRRMEKWEQSSGEDVLT